MFHKPGLMMTRAEPALTKLLLLPTNLLLHNLSERGTASGFDSAGSNKLLYLDGRESGSSRL